ncbi:ClbS/DfsB family four-helix bundle protein [Anaerosphaera multitolerans]|uniref:DfsB family protein n=1 Tax=Anaerosphaera multitolerans TaxID=2487351 RepID=A0A437S666_9FIRM|nr:ClbS/DfsB family four-helix bundle protein [Anaerosphaera multitolerans]RVU54525.1 DfsB family protein [Anaerosphaera multitolerans]
MARPTTKEDLVSKSEYNFEKLMNLVENMTDEEFSISFNFEDDLKKKEVHWKRDKNVRDVFIHLYEWHKLLINWIESNMRGIEKSFLPAPYNWRTYGEMNVKFWEEHQGTTFDESKNLLEESHKKVMYIVETFSNEELFTSKYFSWTGGTTLGSYCVSSTSSHYEWALKKLKAHIKNCKNN